MRTRALLRESLADFGHRAGCRRAAGETIAVQTGEWLLIKSKTHQHAKLPKGEGVAIVQGRLAAKIGFTSRKFFCKWPVSLCISSNW